MLEVGIVLSVTASLPFKEKSQDFCCLQTRCNRLTGLLFLFDIHH